MLQVNTRNLGDEGKVFNLLGWVAGGVGITGRCYGMGQKSREDRGRVGCGDHQAGTRRLRE